MVLPVRLPLTVYVLRVLGTSAAGALPRTRGSWYAVLKVNGKIAKRALVKVT